MAPPVLVGSASPYFYCIVHSQRRANSVPNHNTHTLCVCPDLPSGQQMGGGIPSGKGGSTYLYQIRVGTSPHWNSIFKGLIIGAKNE